MRYMLLASAAPIPGVEPFEAWDPEDVREHVEFHAALDADLRARGELVDAHVLAAPQLAKVVTSDGANPPVVLDGAFPDTKHVVAAYRVVDVASEDRALEIAGVMSAAPGPGGDPIEQAVEVRAVMGPVES